MELDNLDKNKNKDNNNDSLIEQENNKEKAENIPANKNPLVMFPSQSEQLTIVIQSSVLENKESLKAKVGEVLESVKENASNIIDKVVKTEEQDINSFKRDITEANSQSKEQQQQSKEKFVIPVIGEKYAFSKKILSEDINIEKRWEEKDEVKIPIRYEKLFVNDKEINVYSKQGILSQIKEKISDLVQSDNSSSNKDEDTDVKKKENDNNLNENTNKEIEKQKRVKEEKEEPQLKGERIPLFENQQIEKDSETLPNNVTNNNKYEILIPLYAEEITISKKMVKVGEIAISKRKILENENVNIDTIKEQVTIEHADGRKEKITSY
jgi:stress response protein YsnF